VFKNLAKVRHCVMFFMTFYQKSSFIPAKIWHCRMFCVIFLVNMASDTAAAALMTVF